MSIEPAKGKKGFLLYNFFTQKHFFRVYNPDSEEGFTDYDLCAEDIEIEIIDRFTELYEGEDRNRLDYSRRVLGNNEKPLDHELEDEKA